MMIKNKNYFLFGIMFIFSFMSGLAIIQDLYLSASICSIFGIIAILYIKEEPTVVSFFNKII